MAKRAFLIVFDSFGIGGAKDASMFNDEGSNTLKSISKSKNFKINTLKKLGLFNIDGVDIGEPEKQPIASFARAEEKSNGKDSTIGHWEIAGIISEKPLPLFPEGFPDELIKNLEKIWGREIIVNKPYSGTKVLMDYGEEHIKTGKIIVYTSGDSVLQIACHESVASLNELYTMCKQAREICKGDYAVGRVIARPFIGEYPNFVRTHDRKDFSLTPPQKTILNKISESGMSVIGVGKIDPLFNGYGITESISSSSDTDGMNKTIELAKRDFNGLCFVNLVDFDMEYGHRNDIDGYAKNLSDMDKKVDELLGVLKEEDLLVITADHGCDPATESTDHSRENVPVLIYQKDKPSQNLGTFSSFTQIGKYVYKFLKSN